MMPIQEKEPYHILSRPEQVIMVIPRTRNNQWNAHMNKKLNIVPSAAYLVRKIDIPRSIYSKTVNSMTRKKPQIVQLRRHSIGNYLVTDNRAQPSNWPDHVKANDKKKMEKLCTLFISKVQVYKPKAIMHHVMCLSLQY